MLFIFSLSIAGALADFVGPVYPAPADLTSHGSLVAAAWGNLASVWDAYLTEQQQNATAAASLASVQNLTLSTGLFSLHDPAARQLQHHHPTPKIANATYGTHKVDGDGIYRMASVTKLFTVFAGMISLTDEEWNRPVTNIINGLAEFAGGGEQSPLDSIQWDKVAPWALAAQSAGFPSSASPGGDLLLQEKSPTTAFGFPPVNARSFGPCWSETFCSADEFIESIRFYPPSFLPWTTPAYSNAGFILLGITLSNIIGKPMEAVYRESIFGPLGMKSSKSTPPTGAAEITRSVITGDPAIMFALNSSLLTPSGGLFSTTNDLAKFGLAILNSTLLSPSKTRKWMKPITHTASLTYSVGASWEIIRYFHPSTSKVTDVYTKQGGSGYYSGVVALMPDYGAGFSILSAYTNGSERLLATNIILDHITDAILPALDAQATAEARYNFVGSYISTDFVLNSSVTIALDETIVSDTPSGLSTTSWISNGTRLCPP